MGLPGAGKTTLSIALKHKLEKLGKYVIWFNADFVRKEFNDWDFSHEGRIRQSIRMRELADDASLCDFVICDFVAPLVEMRTNFGADYTVWVDTLSEGRFEDTNKVFVKPEKYNIRVDTQDAKLWSRIIAKELLHE